MDRQICHSGGRSTGDRIIIDRTTDAVKAGLRGRRLLIGNRRNDATALQMADFPDDAI